MILKSIDVYNLQTHFRKPNTTIAQIAQSCADSCGRIQQAAGTSGSACFRHANEIGDATRNQKDIEIERVRNRETEVQRDSETKRRRDRETERQRDRETDRQRDKETEKHRDRHTQRHRDRDT